MSCRFANCDLGNSLGHIIVLVDVWPDDGPSPGLETLFQFFAMLKPESPIDRDSGFQIGTPPWQLILALGIDHVDRLSVRGPVSDVLGEGLLILGLARKINKLIGFVLVWCAGHDRPAIDVIQAAVPDHSKIYTLLLSCVDP